MPGEKFLQDQFKDILLQCERFDAFSAGKDPRLNAVMTEANRIYNLIKILRPQIEEFESPKPQWMGDALLQLNQYRKQVYLIARPIDGDGIVAEAELKAFLDAEEKFEKYQRSKNPEDLKRAQIVIDDAIKALANLQGDNEDKSIQFKFAAEQQLIEMRESILHAQTQAPKRKKPAGDGPSDFSDDIRKAAKKKRTQPEPAASIGSSKQKSPGGQLSQNLLPNGETHKAMGFAILDKTPGGKATLYKWVESTTRITEINCKSAHFSTLQTEADKDNHIRNLERMLLAYVVGRGPDDKSPILIGGEDAMSRAILAQLCEHHKLEIECPLGFEKITDKSERLRVQRNAIEENHQHTALPQDLQLKETAISTAAEGTLPSKREPPPPVPENPPPANLNAGVHDANDGNYNRIPASPYVMGGQYISVPAGSALDARFEAQQIVSVNSAIGGITGSSNENYAHLQLRTSGETSSAFETTKYAGPPVVAGYYNAPCASNYGANSTSQVQTATSNMVLTHGYGAVKEHQYGLGPAAESSGGVVNDESKKTVENNKKFKGRFQERQLEVTEKKDPKKVTSEERDTTMKIK